MLHLSFPLYCGGKKGAGVVTQLVECLPKHVQALGLIPSTK